MVGTGGDEPPCCLLLRSVDAGQPLAEVARARHDVVVGVEPRVERVGIDPRFGVDLERAFDEARRDDQVEAEQLARPTVSVLLVFLEGAPQRASGRAHAVGREYMLASDARELLVVDPGTGDVVVAFVHGAADAEEVHLVIIQESIDDLGADAARHVATAKQVQDDRIGPRVDGRGRERRFLLAEVLERGFAFGPRGREFLGEHCAHQALVQIAHDLANALVRRALVAQFGELSLGDGVAQNIAVVHVHDVPRSGLG